MTSSIPPPSNVKASRINFSDGTTLFSAKENVYDARFRKKLRTDGDGSFGQNVLIEGNLTIGGTILSASTGAISTSYVDNQTGWGLEQWSLSGNTYNKNLDSLIVKIYNIEHTFATVSYVDSIIQNSDAKYLTPHDSYTYPKWGDPSSNYLYPVTTLAGRSDFILRTTGEYAQNLCIQNSSTAVGKYLMCADVEGRVTWSDIAPIVSVPSTITTNLGPSDTPSFQIVDSSNGRNAQFYLNTNSSFNPGVPQNSLVFYLSQDVSNPPLACVGTHSLTSEVLQFKSTTNLEAPTGYTKLLGGSTQTDQFLVLGQTGILIQPKLNKGIQILLPYVPYNSANQMWTKPFSIVGVNQIADEYPALIVTKQNQTGNLNSVMINPRCGNDHFSNLCSVDDIQMIFGDTTQYTGEGVTTNFPAGKSKMIIAPWSNFTEGVEIRSTISTETNASGYVRLSGATLREVVGSERVPYTYIMCDQNGITLKCSQARNGRPATSVITYGPSKILNRFGTKLNDLSTQSVTSSFQVGETNSNVPTTLNGTTTINASLFYNLGSKNVGDVLTCTNSSTGLVEWKSQQFATTQQFTDISVENCLVSTTYQAPLIYWAQPLQLTADNYQIGYTLGGYDSSISWFGINQKYFTQTSMFDVAVLQVPANYSGMSLVTIPFYLAHDWGFRYADNDSGANTDNSTCRFYYNMEKIEFYLFEYGTQNIVLSDIFLSNGDNTLGQFYCEYYRGDTNDQPGPKDDKHKMTTEFMFSNIGFQFVTPRHSTTKSYQIKARYHWSHRYTGINLRNYWGDGDPLKRWDHWRPKFLNPTPAPSTSEFPHFYTLSTDMRDGGSSETAHANQWGNKEWNRYAKKYNVNNFQWGALGPVFYPIQNSLTSFNTSPKQVTVSVLNTNKIYCKSIESLGFLSTAGIRSRPGVGNNEEEPYITIRELPYVMGHYDNGFESYFNFHWNKERVQVWVDNTLVYEVSPNWSDYRLKSNLRPVPQVLDRLLTIPMHQYDIHHTNLYDVENRTGFLAHEIQDIFQDFPNLVSGSKDEQNSNGDIVPQTIDLTELNMILLKAVQELTLKVLKLELKLANLTT